MDYEPDWWVFASDRDRLLVWGAVCLVAAGAAFLLDRRRHRRDRLTAADRVGMVSWTAVFLLTALLGFGLIAAALAS